MEEIINKLEKINDFEVISRTSAENYRNTDKNIKTIARELGVNYVLEGSGQKIGDKIKISIQLIESKSDMHLWSKPFIKEVIFENIFELYEEVATSVAQELKTNLTSAEKEQIKKLPTNNFAAYNLYLRGLDHLSIYNYGRNTNELFIAKRLFEQAVTLDTTFADSYRQLGHICITALSAYPDLNVSIHFLELGKTLIDKAIYFDENQNVMATLMTYYLKKGLFQEAEELFKNTFSDKVKDYKYYEHAFNYYLQTNKSEAIESFYRFIQLKPEELMVSPQTWLEACKLFNSLGFSQIAATYAKKLLIQTSDTVLYYYVIAEGQLWEGNIKHAREEALKGHKLDKPLFSPNRPVFIVGYCDLLLRDYSKFLEYIKYIEDIFAGFKYPVAPDVGMGYAYLQNEIAEKADYHFNGVEKRSLKEIDLNTPDAQNFISHFNLALIYSLRGEKSKAIGYLQKIKQKETIDIWSITQLKHHPAFDNTRDESEFAEILQDVESKYQKEHERVGKIIKKFERNK
jgi:tetratricopeptide (TPR) repeat protein